MLSTLLALALAAAPAKAPAPEKLDALDFDNGAFLVEEAPSYSTGVGAWTAWRLADGSPMGWCSPEHQLGPAAFTWELDSSWALESLAIDNTEVERESYPGIAAKQVELLVAGATGAFKSVGTFVANETGRLSFPLPKGTTANRVKVIVKNNHGNDRYTELGELDLLGTRLKPAPLARIDGVFSTTYGPMRFVQDGDQVYGCYDWGTRTGWLWGTATGRIVKTTWYEDAENAGDENEGTATFGLTGKTFWGVFFGKDGTLSGEWRSNDEAVEPPQCQPQRKGLMALRLKKQGRLALYGIRFDTNSDVPRPESEATLKELASVLAADEALKVVIEGHTDSTNTDEYNLDLSNRRAKAVVAWLVARGVKADRLVGKGFGRSKPTADNATAQGRALNRRVEVAKQE